jgi:hypothetical protein
MDLVAAVRVRVGAGRYAGEVVLRDPVIGVMGAARMGIEGLYRGLPLKRRVPGRVAQADQMIVSTEIHTDQPVPRPEAYKEGSIVNLRSMRTPSPHEA